MMHELLEGVSFLQMPELLYHFSRLQHMKHPYLTTLEKDLIWSLTGFSMSFFLHM